MNITLKLQVSENGDISTYNIMNLIFIYDASFVSSVLGKLNYCTRQCFREEADIIKEAFFRSEQMRFYETDETVVFLHSFCAQYCHCFS